MQFTERQSQKKTAFFGRICPSIHMHLLDQNKRKSPRDFSSKICKLISLKCSFQTIASSSTNFAMSSSYVTVQKNLIVKRMLISKAKCFLTSAKFLSQ